MDKEAEIPSGCKLILAAKEAFPHHNPSAEASALLDQLDEAKLRKRYCYHLLGPPKEANTGHKMVASFFWRIRDEKRKCWPLKRIPKHLLRYFHKSFVKEDYEKYKNDPYTPVKDPRGSGGFLFDPRFYIYKSSKQKFDKKKRPDQKADQTPTQHYPTFEVSSEHMDAVHDNLARPQRNPTWSIYDGICNNYNAGIVKVKQIRDMLEHEEILGLWKPDFIITNPLAVDTSQEYSQKVADEMEYVFGSQDKTDGHEDPMTGVEHERPSEDIMVVDDEESHKDITHTYTDVSPFWISLNEVRTMMNSIGISIPDISASLKEFEKNMDEMNLGKSYVMACLKIFATFFPIDKQSGEPSAVPPSPKWEPAMTNDPKEYAKTFMWITTCGIDKIYRWKKVISGSVYEQKTLNVEVTGIKHNLLWEALYRNCKESGISTVDSLREHSFKDTFKDEMERNLAISMFDYFFPRLS